MARRTSRRYLPEGREWLTAALLLSCYGVWLAATWFHDASPLAAIAVAIYLTTLHSSLQHEALHGHPTRSAGVNEALVYVPLGLFVPYRRFKTLHLRHHCDERLTDPYDDPESWFVAERDWIGMPRFKRAVLSLNMTLAGRLLIGPALSVLGLWRHDFRAMRAGSRAVRWAYAHHAAGLAMSLAWLWGVCGINPLVYAAVVAYPAMSLLMVRTFAEHRASPEPAARSVLIEGSAFFSLLFLNNNLHYVHHKNPRAPWYTLPALFRRRRAAFLRENGGYRFAGYGELFRRYFLRPVGPVVHPLRRRRHRA